MNKRFLLILPSWCHAFGDFKAVAKGTVAFPPINLLIVAGLARDAGWDVKVVDGEADQLSVDQLVEITKEYKPDLVGLTATTPFAHAAEEVARAIKQHITVPIAIGGPHPTAEKGNALKDLFDYAFVGECELNLKDFLDGFAAGRHPIEVPGVYQSNGQDEPFYFGDIGKIEDLDEAPVADRRLLTIDNYKLGTPNGWKTFTMLQMTRGCPFECVFCAADMYGRTVRRRSMKNVGDELEHIVNDLGIKHIYMMDDTLTLKRKYIMEFCDEIEKRNLKFTFEGMTRANLWDEEMVLRLKKCGLVRISYGLESADENVRKLMKKNVPLESYVEANALNNRLGIETTNSVMIGLPGETEESIEKTIKYLNSHKEIQHATYGIAIPYPGTELLKMAREGEHGLELVDEDTSNYQRYGKAVMNVNGLKPEELLRLQKTNLLRIYSKWWRIMPTLRRHGFKSLVRPAASAMLALVKNKISSKNNSSPPS